MTKDERIEQLKNKLKVMDLGYTNDTKIMTGVKQEHARLRRERADEYIREICGLGWLAEIYNKDLADGDDDTLFLPQEHAAAPDVVIPENFEEQARARWKEDNGTMRGFAAKWNSDAKRKELLKELMLTEAPKEQLVEVPSSNPWVDDWGEEQADGSMFRPGSSVRQDDRVDPRSEENKKGYK